jgi:hypothetical protein
MEDIAAKVKSMILPTIENQIHPDDARQFGLRKIDLAEIAFTQIMALAYNKGDINSAVNDLLPTRNPFVYPGNDMEEAANLSLHLAQITEDFKFQYWAFLNYVRMSNEGKDEKDILLEVKKALLMVM